MKALRVLAATGLGCAALISVHTPAAVADSVGAPSTTRCASGEYCVFKDSHYNDSVAPFSYNDGSWSDGQSFINDEDSSAYNRSGATAAHWQDSGWGGPRIACLSNNTGTSHQSTNDEGSSNWIGDCNMH
jgi:hypothetical protein